MTKERKKPGPKPEEIPQMPFDDALRALLGTSPQHKKAVKQKDKRREKKK